MMTAEALTTAMLGILEKAGSYNMCFAKWG